MMPPARAPAGMDVVVVWAAGSEEEVAGAVVLEAPRSRGTVFEKMVVRAGLLKPPLGVVRFALPLPLYCC